MYALLEGTDYKALARGLEEHLLDDIVHVYSESYRNLRHSGRDDLADFIQLLALRIACSKMDRGNIRPGFEYLATAYEVYKIPVDVELNAIFNTTNLFGCNVFAVNCLNPEKGFKMPFLTLSSSLQFALYESTGPGVYLSALLNICAINHNLLMDIMNAEWPSSSTSSICNDDTTVHIQSMKYEHTLHTAVVRDDNFECDYFTQHDDDYVPPRCPTQFDFGCGSSLVNFWSFCRGYGNGRTVVYRYNEIEDTIALEFFRTLKRLSFDSSGELPVRIQYTDEIFVRNLRILDSLCKSFPQLPLSQTQLDAVARVLRHCGLPLNSVLFDIRHGILVLMAARPKPDEKHAIWKEKLLTSSLRVFRQQYLGSTSSTVTLFDLEHVAELRVSHLLGLLECIEDCVGESVLGAIMDNPKYNCHMAVNCVNDMEQYIGEIHKVLSSWQLTAVIDVVLVSLRRIAIRMLSVSLDESGLFKPELPIQVLLSNPEFHLLPKDTPESLGDEFPLSLTLSMFSALHRYLLKRQSDEDNKKVTYVGAVEPKPVVIETVTSSSSTSVAPPSSSARLFTIAAPTSKATIARPMTTSSASSSSSAAAKKKQK